jgi:hypothetical protein
MRKRPFSDAKNDRGKGMVLGTLLGITIGVLVQYILGTEDYIFKWSIIFATVIIVISLYPAGFSGMLLTGTGIGLITAVLLGSILFTSYTGV